MLTIHPRLAASVPTTVLDEAQKGGNVAIVRTILAANPDILGAFKEQCEMTALGVAAENDHEDVVRYLLDIGDGPLNYQDEEGYAPLHCAVQSNDIGTVKALLERPDVDINLAPHPPNRYSRQRASIPEPPNSTIVTGSPQDRPQSSHPGGQNTACGSRRPQLLREARVGVAQVLISSPKVDKNVTDKDGTLLHAASGTGQDTREQVAILNMLLPFLKGNIWHRNRHRQTVLDMAAGRGSVVALERDGSASEAFGGSTPLHNAIESGDINTVGAFWEYDDVDVNCSALPLSPLELATTVPCPTPEIVNALLDHPRINPNTRIAEGSTALTQTITAHNGRPDLVRVFIAHDSVDISAPDAHGNTPFHLAAASSLQAFNLLLPLVQETHTIWDANNQGETALGLAASTGQKEVVDRLLDPDLGATRGIVEQAMVKPKAVLQDLLLLFQASRFHAMLSEFQVDMASMIPEGLDVMERNRQNASAVMVRMGEGVREALGLLTVRLEEMGA
ncbi:ankyrin repeat domain-containing protein [Aspergillus mulundensis]|uniref:Ankyrin repeat protein n=1 Tax=Aspergillus mulundensis TaxID=1810919 RepID=A0A3D8SCR3_9EURO|nr:hypothetical protein DSM5745_04425 [Aspergillus mulundensis]RDW84099.1 hypothetical protein DSM5745_04425 [Aspergillus mulundensis]